MVELEGCLHQEANKSPIHFAQYFPYPHFVEPEKLRQSPFHFLKQQ
jgi:hypothetical protein